MTRLADVLAGGSLEQIPHAEIPALLGELEAVKATLWVRLQTAPTPAVLPIGNGKATEDRLLDVREAARLLDVSPRWVYRRSGELPFVRRLSSGTLRFSEKGLHRWKESRA